MHRISCGIWYLQHLCWWTYVTYLTLGWSAPWFLAKNKVWKTPGMISLVLRWNYLFCLQYFNMIDVWGSSGNLKIIQALIQEGKSYFMYLHQQTFHQTSSWFSMIDFWGSSGNLKIIKALIQEGKSYFMYLHQQTFHQTSNWSIMHTTRRDSMNAHRLTMISNCQNIDCGKTLTASNHWQQQNIDHAKTSTTPFYSVSWRGLKPNEI